MAITSAKHNNISPPSGYSICHMATTSAIIKTRVITSTLKSPMIIQLTITSANGHNISPIP